MSEIMKAQEDPTNLIHYYFTANGGTTGLISPSAALYLHAAVLAGLNIVILGTAGSGKNALINALGQILPENDKKLVLEDAPGICFFIGTLATDIMGSPVSPSAIPGDIPSNTQVDSDKSTLFKHSRQLSYGEVLCTEVFDLLTSLQTLKKRGVTTLQSTGVEELVPRLYLLLGHSETGRTLTPQQSATLVAGAFHIFITLDVICSRRYIREIGEFTGELIGAADCPELQTSIIFKPKHETSVLQGPLCKSIHGDRFRDAGVDPVIFEKHIESGI